VPSSLVQPYPKEGVVVAGRASLDPMRRVEPNSPEWNTVAQALLEPFAVAEQTAVSLIPEWSHPVPADIRRRVPITVETMYSAPMDAEGWTAYFLESVKHYVPGPDDGGCGLMTSVTGWSMAGPNFKREFRLDAVVSYCDRRSAVYFLPFGRVTANEKTYWVYQQAGYGQEHYIVARPTPKAVEGAVGYAATQCPR
jgi:hypothetical protein